MTSSNPAPATSAAGTSSSGEQPVPSGLPIQLLSQMTLRQKIGQLLMVDCPSSGASSATITAIRQYHVGSVILDGNSDLGVLRTRRITDAVRAQAPARTGLLIATDQEGGLVQRLRGPGFDSMPSGWQQGRLRLATLRADAATWAQELHRAGVNLNLAPVTDTVPPGDTNNPPIGDLDREFAHYPARVAHHAVAFLRGMRDGGVSATIKHFPGLGRVTGNTDTTSGVTDTVTVASGPYVQAFGTAINAGAPFVMMSTAIYRRIDPAWPAAFSHWIVTHVLRGTYGFTGVVISDDLGAAAQVSGYPVGLRAIRFIQAGGDLVLTVVASQAALMTHALFQKALSSRRFRGLVNAAALRVLRAKQALGLLG